MKIAVITPSKPNRTHLLEECKASVEAQTLKAWTHAIEVDVNCEGPAVVRNRIVASLSHDIDWIAFLDDDDVFLPNHLEVLAQEAHHGDVIYSLCDQSLSTGGFSYEALRGCNYIPITTLVRRSVFESLGGFDNKPYEDWELWKKIANHGAGRFIFIPEKTWLYRIQGDSRNAGH